MNATTVMMQLGEYQFSLNTAAYQNLTHQAQWRWPGQERLTRDPALQYVGPGQQSIQLKGVIFPDYWGGVGQLDKMRGEADKGAPLPLIASWQGEGRVLGQFVIESISETQTEFWANGKPRRVEFDMSLKKYVGDKA